MNSLLHRMIPAMLSLILPFSLQAAEAIPSDMQEPAAITQVVPESAENSASPEEASATETVTEAAASTEVPKTEESQPAPDAPQIEAAVAPAAEGEATSAAEEPKKEGTFTITTYEIEGNLLVPTETIEKKLQRYIGESKDRNDLFRIRNAIIKIYRKAKLKGVSVSIPTSAEGGVILVKIFEDDIPGVYPQQSKTPAKVDPAAAGSPDVALDSTAAPAQEPESATIEAVAEPELPELAKAEAVEETPEESVVAEQLTTVASSPQQSEVEKVAVQTEKKPLQPETVATETEPATAKEPVRKRVEQKQKTLAAPQKVEKQIEKAAAPIVKPAVKKRVVATKKPTVAKVTAKEKKPVSKKHSEQASAKSVDAPKKAVKAKQKAPATTVKASASTPAIDTAEGQFNIESFEVYGNSLVTTAEIQKLLNGSTGTDKSYADLISAKQGITKLYRAKGYKMVAVGMPARIFGETVPVRIYEAKGKR